MEKDIFIDRQQMELEDGKKVCLQYFLTQEAGQSEKNFYGIKVEKWGEILEVENTGPISQSEDWVRSLCTLIAGNQVTPIGLINVVDDIMTGN